MDISKIIERDPNLFLNDLESNMIEIKAKVNSSSFLVIGGAGSIGQAVTKEIFSLNPKKLHIIDINENELVELVRDIRSSLGYIVGDFATFCMDASEMNLKRLFEDNGGYDFVLNLSALKHVRSEKDKFSLERMIEVNIFNTVSAYEISKEFNSSNYFCVSTDKAANPVNLMGCSKRIMEIYLNNAFDSKTFSSARFANVAFSNGSLLNGFTSRILKKHPIAAPEDIKRYFVSHEESGRLCLMASLIGTNGQIFFPNLDSNLHLIDFKSIAINFLRTKNLKPYECSSEQEARDFFTKINKESFWPCYFFKSDTSGEKDYEEFYTSDENVDFNSFKEIGIINQQQIDSNPVIDYKGFKREVSKIFKNQFNKEGIVSLFESIVPEFKHLEKDKSLEQKM